MCLSPICATDPGQVILPELSVLHEAPAGLRSLTHRPSVDRTGQGPGHARERPREATHPLTPVLGPALPLHAAGSSCQSPLPRAPRFPSLPIHSHKARTRVQHAWSSARGLRTFKDASTCLGADNSPSPGFFMGTTCLSNPLPPVPRCSPTYSSGDDLAPKQQAYFLPIHYRC